MGLLTAEIEQLVQAARLHLAKGELQEAVGQATEVIRRDSKQTAAYLVRAEAHRRLKRPDRALADLAVAIRLDPSQPGPFVIRAEILKRRNLFDQAIADATHAIALDPRNAGAFSIRAECRSAIGDMEGATEDVQEMVHIDPTRSVPNLERGSSPPPMASDDQRFWKEASPTDPKLNGDIFADGKPADRSLKSRKPIKVKDAAEALVDATDYRPEVMTEPLPRVRARRKGPQIIPIVVGLACIVFVGGGYVLINRSQNSQEASPPEAKTQPLIAPTASQIEPQQPITVSTTPLGVEESTQPSPTAVSPVVQATNNQKNPPTTTPVAADSPVMTTTVPSIESTRRLEGHTGNVLGAVFSPDGALLASASVDSTVRLWSVSSNLAENSHLTLETTSTEAPEPFISVAFSPDGKLLAASSKDGRIFLWNVRMKRPGLLRILRRNSDSVVAIAFSPDSKLLATGGMRKGLVSIWNLADPGFPLRNSIPSENSSVWSLAYSPDGALLFEGIVFTKKAATPSQNSDPVGQIWVWDLGQRPYVKKSIIREVRFRPRSIVFSPDGSHIAYGDGDVARVVDLRTGKQVTTFENHTGPVISVAYTRNGKYVLSGAYDKTARLWDATTGEQVTEFGDATDAIESAALSPDGRLIAIAGHEKVIRLLQLRQVSTRKSEPSDLKGLSPVGKWVELRPGTPVGDRVRTFLADGTYLIQTPKNRESLVGTWRKDDEKIYESLSSQEGIEPPTANRWFTISAQDEKTMTVLMMGTRQYVWYKAS
jgi:WD40 repeat protein